MGHVKRRFRARCRAGVENLRRLPQSSFLIVGTVAVLIIIGAFAFRERGQDTHPAAAQVTTTPAVAVTAPIPAATRVPSPTATTPPALPTSTPQSCGGAVLGGRECNADLRSWIDRFGSLGHGENSYDHWVSLGKPRDGADQPSLLQGWYRKGFEDSLLRLERSGVHEWTAKRQRLIRFIWGEAGFPAEKTPDAVEKGISDRRYTSIENLASIDRIEVRMEFGAQSIIYLFHPRSSNSRLLIYHQGHGGGVILGVDTIQFFVRHGYTVAAFSMPMLGMNGPLVIETPDGSITLRKHPDLGSLESEVFSPLKFFVEPLIVFLNYAMAEYAYDTAAMVGISGGGWTTTLAAALEPRIVRSYPVAGSLPLVFGGRGGLGADAP